MGNQRKWKKELLMLMIMQLGFVGLNRMRIDGTDFCRKFHSDKKQYILLREERKPLLVCAKTVLIGHHTSGVRREFIEMKQI